MRSLLNKLMIFSFKCRRPTIALHLPFVIGVLIEYTKQSGYPYDEQCQEAIPVIVFQRQPIRANTRPHVLSNMQLNPLMHKVAKMVT